MPIKTLPSKIKIDENTLCDYNKQKTHELITYILSTYKNIRFSHIQSGDSLELVFYSTLFKDCEIKTTNPDRITKHLDFLLNKYNTLSSLNFYFESIVKINYPLNCLYIKPTDHVLILLHDSIIIDNGQCHKNIKEELEKLGLLYSTGKYTKMA